MVDSAKTDSLPTVLVCYGWGGANRGDCAITCGMYELLTENCRDVKSEILPYNREGPIPDEIKSNENYMRRILQNISTSNTTGIFSLIISGFKLGLLLLSPKLYGRYISPKNKEDIEKISESDLIIYNGGHIFFSFDQASIWENVLLLKSDLAVLLPALLSLRLGISYGLWGHSVGPFENGTCFLHKLIIENASFIYTRESISKANVESLQKEETEKQIENLPDLAFERSWDYTYPDISALNSSEEYICITVRRSASRQGVDLPADVYTQYLEELVLFIDKWISSKGGKVVLVPQIDPQNASVRENDVYVAKELEKKSSNSESIITIEETLSIDELISIYCNSKCVIGTRFHSLIFSLQAQTPVIALTSDFFGPKTEGLMTDLQLRDALIQLDNLDSHTLFQKVQEACEKGDFACDLESKYSFSSSEGVRRIILSNE